MAKTSQHPCSASQALNDLFGLMAFSFQARPIFPMNETGLVTKEWVDFSLRGLASGTV